MGWGDAKSTISFSKEKLPAARAARGGGKKTANIRSLTEKTTSDKPGSLGKDGREKHESDRNRKRTRAQRHFIFTEKIFPLYAPSFLASTTAVART